SYIAYNGAFAIHRGQEILEEVMDVDTVKKFIQIAKEQQHELVMYTDHKNYFTTLDSEIVQTFIDTFHIHNNGLLSEEYYDQVLGMTVITTQENADTNYQFEDIHLSQVNVRRVDKCFDVIRDHVNKGVAVKTFLEKVNYPIE